CWRGRFRPAMARRPAASGAWRGLVGDARSWPVFDIQCFGKQRRDAVDIPHHLVVPKSQYAIAVRREPAIATLVGYGVGVLPAVHFDDQAPFEADEVGDKSSDRNLTAKLEFRKSSIAEHEPQLALGNR